MLGESSVGKSNLLVRYISDKFNPNGKPTIGLDFLSKEVSVEGKEAKVQFWDTAGQEKYRSMARNYYKMADGVFLVYDTTRRDTFDKLENWLQELKEQCKPGTKIMLIGNKNDLKDQMVVSSEEGKGFAEENGLFFWETSALTNNEGCVNKAFDELIKECVTEAYSEYLEDVSTSFDKIRKNTKMLLDDTEPVKKKEQGCCG